MTQEEFRNLALIERPLKRNLTLEQFIAEQSVKTDRFDYEGTTVCYSTNYAYRVPYHLRSEDAVSYTHLAFKNSFIKLSPKRR